MKLSISIHAPRVGSDPSSGYRTRWRRHFNPRSPCGERLEARLNELAAVKISIHAPRVGSDICFFQVLRFSQISIHAPRVGSDQFMRGHASTGADFNPRSPCGERQWYTAGRGGKRGNFNPRSPCGERR